MNSKWPIMAVYEGTEARDRAMRFCDCLVQKFWPEFSFELSWFDFAELEDEAAAKDADHKAIEAQLIILSTARQGKIPLHARRWLEQAIRYRSEREGFLVGLTGRAATAQTTVTQLYLRRLAHESGMDYLTAVPQSLPRGSNEDSVESYNLRATCVTNVLGAILNQSPFPLRSL